MARDDELAIFLHSVRHSMEMLVHPLSSMVSTLNQWSCKLQENCQDSQEVHHLDEKLHAVLAIILEIAGKSRRTIQADD